jgi:hypothetical protein
MSVLDGQRVLEQKSCGAERRTTINKNKKLRR